MMKEDTTQVKADLKALQEQRQGQAQRIGLEMAQAEEEATTVVANYASTGSLTVLGAGGLQQQ